MEGVKGEKIEEKERERERERERGRSEREREREKSEKRHLVLGLIQSVNHSMFMHSM